MKQSPEPVELSSSYHDSCRFDSNITLPEVLLRSEHGTPIAEGPGPLAWVE